MGHKQVQVVQRHDPTMSPETGKGLKLDPVRKTPKERLFAYIF